MDDELLEDLLALYRRLRDDHEDADDETLASLIMWDLRDCEVLDLACDALDDHSTGVGTTQELAMHRIRTLVHAFKKYHPDT